MENPLMEPTSINGKSNFSQIYQLSTISGWWFFVTPLKNMKVKWEGLFHILWKKMFETTDQIGYNWYNI